VPVQSLLRLLAEHTATLLNPAPTNANLVDKVPSINTAFSQILSDSSDAMTDSDAVAEKKKTVDPFP
jgi:hypothetical protein